MKTTTKENKQENLLPGMSLLQTRIHQYHACLQDAYDRHYPIRESEDYVEAVLQQTAANCHVAGLPMEFAVKQTMFNSQLNQDALQVREVFQLAYNKELTQTFPMKFIKPSALLTYRTEAFLNVHYDMRLNVMTGVAQYRRKDEYGYSFRDLTERALNTMAMDALKAGLDSWDRDIRRYIKSDRIPEYDPVNDYLDHLPRWDGHDRVATFARRVQTQNPDWTYNFHIWMRAMVANWMGRNRKHGNAIVPLLIGRQGCGKSISAI